MYSVVEVAFEGRFVIRRVGLMIVRKAHGGGALASSVSNVVAAGTSGFSSGSNHFDDGPALKLL